MSREKSGQPLDRWLREIPKPAGAVDNTAKEHPVEQRTGHLPHTSESDDRPGARPFGRASNERPA